MLRRQFIILWEVQENIPQDNLSLNTIINLYLTSKKIKPTAKEPTDTLIWFEGTDAMGVWGLVEVMVPFLDAMEAPDSSYSQLKKRKEGFVSLLYIIRMKPLLVRFIQYAMQRLHGRFHNEGLRYATRRLVCSLIWKAANQIQGTILILEFSWRNNLKRTLQSVSSRPKGMLPVVCSGNVWSSHCHLHQKV